MMAYTCTVTIFTYFMMMLNYHNGTYKSIKVQDIPVSTL